jgi:hypothetical protein
VGDTGSPRDRCLGTALLVSSLSFLLQDQSHDQYQRVHGSSAAATAECCFRALLAGRHECVGDWGGAQIAVRVPAVVVSHGKNGNGAYTVLGTQTPAGADADEVGNQLINGGLDAASLNFVYKRPTPGFDDEVVWIPPGVLFGRMIRAGRLP